MATKIEKPVRISSFAELMQHCEEEEATDFFILLNGNARSSKSIYRNEAGTKAYVCNEIDDTHQVLTAKTISTRSLIGEAMEKGAFYKY